MKTLDAAALQTGIDKIRDYLITQKEQMKKVENDVIAIVSLDDTLKGNGGQSIRSYYRECHEPFLLFFETFIGDYENALNKMKNALQALESSPNGFIRQSFLQNELENGLQQRSLEVCHLAM